MGIILMLDRGGGSLIKWFIPANWPNRRASNFGRVIAVQAFGAGISITLRAHQEQTNFIHE
jgi:hypothetical protein